MESLELSFRAKVLSEIHTAVYLYFAHWEALPIDFDFEAEFDKALEAGLTTSDRKEFCHIAMRLIASLKNGHSSYADSAVAGNPLGFRLKFIEGQRVIVHSQRPELNIGDVITHINEQPIEAFFDTYIDLISASSDFERQNKFFLMAHVLDNTFSLTLDDSRIIEIERTPLEPNPIQVPHRWIEDNKIGYMHIPRFNPNQYEEQALQALDIYKDAQKLIIDIRQNGGGATPSNLIDALMDRPYRGRSKSTPMHHGVFGVYADIPDLFADQISEELAEQMRSFTPFKRGSFLWHSTPHVADKTVFSNQLIVLTDGYTGSAAEDFALAFKVSGRATLMGERTVGSTGQPYFRFYDNGINFRISAKREIFPDGSPFEGHGVTPDIENPTTIEDLKSGHDPVLEAAIRY